MWARYGNRQAFYRLMTKNYYFASDFHLGLEHPTPSKEREKIIVSWLDSIINNTEELFILGDLFDYWYEYSEVVPRGHVRTLAKIAEFSDKGIPVHIFTGNHDMWMFGYLEEELGVKIYKKPEVFDIHGKKFFLGHGDGLGPGDHGYKFIKKVFSNRLNQWLYARIHANTGIKLMRRFSKTSREAQAEIAEFKGPEGEWLIQYCERKLKELDIDYFIFGHRHIPINHLLSNGKSRYINTGDWVHHYSYACFDGDSLQLKKFGE